MICCVAYKKPWRQGSVSSGGQGVGGGITGVRHPKKAFTILEKERKGEGGLRKNQERVQGIIRKREKGPAAEKEKRKTGREEIATPDASGQEKKGSVRCTGGRKKPAEGEKRRKEKERNLHVHHGLTPAWPDAAETAAGN